MRGAFDHERSGPPREPIWAEAKAFHAPAFVLPHGRARRPQTAALTLMARYFFDTNVLVYAVDAANPEKRYKALDLIDQHARAGDVVISTQVLQEFYVAATRRLGIEPFTARQHVRDFQLFDLVQITKELVEKGIDQSILTQLSFWDGLILAAAQTARCAVLYSEDMNDGQSMGGVTVLNPFKGSVIVY